MQHRTHPRQLFPTIKKIKYPSKADDEKKIPDPSISHLHLQTHSRVKEINQEQDSKRKSKKQNTQLGYKRVMINV
jgi:hypothetical protein